MNCHTQTCTSFTWKPVMWPKKGRFLRLLQWETEEKQQETVQNWKQPPVHCNYDTARPKCGIRWNNYGSAAATNQPSAHWNHMAGRNQTKSSYFSHRRSHNAQSCHGRNLYREDGTCVLPQPVYYQTERLLQVLDRNKTLIICVLTALSWASLQISHLLFSERSWLESFLRSPRHF